MKMQIFKALCAILLFAASYQQAHAAPMKPLEKLNGKYTYQIRWNGIGIGRVYLTLEETDKRYSIMVDTKTRGIVDMFAPLRSLIQASGRISEDGQYIPRRYDARSHSDRGGRKVAIRYNREGQLYERMREPMDDPNWRPEVPLTELESITDPLTGFLRFRKEFYKNLHAEKEETAVVVYDGRRLAEIRLKAINPTRRTIDGESMNTVNSVVFRTPVNGYTPKELAKWEEGDPTVHMYFGLNPQFMPEELNIQLGFGTVTAMHEREGE